MTSAEIEARLERLQFIRTANQPWHGRQWTIDQISLAATSRRILSELAACDTMTPEQQQRYRLF